MDSYVRLHICKAPPAPHYRVRLVTFIPPASELCNNSALFESLRDSVWLDFCHGPNPKIGSCNHHLSILTTHVPQQKGEFFTIADVNFRFFIWHIPINDKKWLTWPVSLFLWRPLLEKKYQDLVPQQAGLDGGLDRLQNCANQMKNRRIQSSNKNSKQILKVCLF